MSNKSSFNYICIIVLSLLGPLLQAGETETEYMAIMLEDHKIGHLIQSRSVEGSTVVTNEDFSMTLGRGGQKVTVHSKETHIETTEGKPVSFEISMKASGIEQKTSGTIQGDKIHLTRQFMGNSQNTVLDWPTGTLMPEGIRLLQKEKGIAPGCQYEVVTFSTIDSFEPLRIKFIVRDKKKIDVRGKTLELTEIKKISSIKGQETTETHYVDDDLKSLKIIAPVMGKTLVFVACDKSFAMRNDDVVDFLEKFSIASPTKLTNLDTIDSIVYEIIPNTDKQFDLPNSSHQTIQQDNGRFQVTVKQLTPPENIIFPYGGKDPNILKATEATEYLQSDYKEIIDLANAAVVGTTDAAIAAQKIISFVAGYIQKRDLSVGYASAAEVAQSRQGDCSEHALLTAAMCRAVGIPARIVSGVLYVDSPINQKSIFGGHMWVEVYLDGQWFGLDATRANQNSLGFGFGPDHIALAHGNGSPTDFFSLANTLGCFKIEAMTIHRAETKKQENLKPSK